MRSPRLYFFILTSLLCAAPAARADVYGYVDENGVETFSDLPVDRRAKLLWRDTSRRPATLTPAPARTLRSPSGELRSHIDTIARAYDLAPELLTAVAAVESGFNPRAVSPKGAQGLMQLMPDTARRYGVRNALDPVDNLHGAARYLRDLLALFDQNLELALAAYNAGENAVLRHGRQIPPYAETRAYVPKVLAQLEAARGQGLR